MADQEHYDFHYQPTGSGAISGQQVLEQTEDAINELGDYVNDNVGGAMDVAQEALETAQNAQNDAQTALDTANSFSSAIQTAQQDANTALSTAQTAQTTATNANATAIQASQDASSAVTTANNASGQVSTLSGTVTTLGQRVTTAEGNIGQNTSDITALTTRVGTAEGNITTLQNDVTIAQGNASSAMATAGQVKQQAFVFRYSSTALVASSTNSNSLLDNTDNLKVGDKVIDSSGVLFSITAIDSVNSTFTVGSALIDLALDANVMHLSGNETADGYKTFSKYITSDGSAVGDEYTSNAKTNLWLMGNRDVKNVSGILFDTYRQNTAQQGTGIHILGISIKENSVRYEGCRFGWYWDNSLNGYTFDFKPTTQGANQALKHNLGTSTDKWSEVHGVTYYYGSNNVEFSTKFVTTDTSQSSILGTKVWTGRQDWAVNCCRIVSNAFEKGEIPSSDVNRNDYYILKNGSTSYASALGVLGGGVSSTNVVTMRLQAIKNASNSTLIASIAIKYNSTTNEKILETNGDFLPTDNASQNIGNSTNKWSTINGLEPSSLGMPDLDNGVDISSYITVVANANKESLYTPPANGWISVALSRTSGSHAVLLKQGNFASSGHNIAQENGTTTCNAMLPVKGGVQVSINSALADGIAFAYFYPCLGNV